MKPLLRFFTGKFDLQTALTVAAGAYLAVFLASYLLQMQPPRDQYGHLAGRDFVNTWMGARAVLEGKVGDLLHVGVHMQRLVAEFGAMPPHNWSYPPVLLLFIWPLGFLPYMGALAVWSLAGFAAYLAASASFDRRARTLAFIAVAPAVGIDLFSGQTGFFTAAVTILVCRTLDERPVLAGILLGLLLVKPHLAVLFPLALLASRRWRCFFAAGATVLGLAGAAMLAFGADIWTDYFRLVMPVQRGVLDTGTGFLNMMPTGFMNARLMGAPLALAWKVQLPFTLAAAAAVIWAYAKRRDPLLSFAVLLTASIVVTPYAFNYDMVAFGWLTAMLWPRFRGPWDKALLLAIWTLPATMLPLGDWHLPVSAPLMGLFLIRLTVMLSRDGTYPASVLPMEPRSRIASSSRVTTPFSPARSQARGS